MRHETESEHAKHWPASFRPIMTLAEKLRRGEPFNCTTVAAELGLTPKTIQRAIAQLRAQGWVINYDERAHEYWLRKAPRPRLF